MRAGDGENVGDCTKEKHELEHHVEQVFAAPDDEQKEKHQGIEDE